MEAAFSSKMLVPTYPDYIHAVTSTLKMKSICSSEVLIPSYQNTWCHNAEDHSTNLLTENMIIPIIVI
jgi:hypothetical protein